MRIHNSNKRVLYSATPLYLEILNISFHFISSFVKIYPRIRQPIKEIQPGDKTLCQASALMHSHTPKETSQPDGGNLIPFIVSHSSIWP
jgi:hypothetical protein